MVDKLIVDGVFVHGSALIVSVIGGGLRYLQSGRAQSYILVIFGFIILGLLFLLKG